ncbi:hypothetical protein DFH06DRAFT_1127516 [Mycena polygramma]|nr:hypothetical protein DFH06DRAFT_1127516 [Mycena polygramma]
MPGVAVAGKLAVAQISKELGRAAIIWSGSLNIRLPTVVFMVGLLGHPEPMFTLADWSATKTEVEAKIKPLFGLWRISLSKRHRQWHALQSILSVLKTISTSKGCSSFSVGMMDQNFVRETGYSTAAKKTLPIILVHDREVSYDLNLGLVSHKQSRTIGNLVRPTAGKWQCQEPWTAAMRADEAGWGDCQKTWTGDDNEKNCLGWATAAEDERGMRGERLRSERKGGRLRGSFDNHFEAISRPKNRPTQESAWLVGTELAVANQRRSTDVIAACVSRGPLEWKPVELASRRVRNPPKILSYKAHLDRARTSHNERLEQLN